MPFIKVKPLEGEFSEHQNTRGSSSDDRHDGGRGSRGAEVGIWVVRKRPRGVVEASVASK
jgi:hypothetical protein